MRSQSVSLSALGFSPWLNINRIAGGSISIGLGCRISSGASLTYSVQHTYDDITANVTQEWSASRATTTGTITRVGHKLSVGDWVQMDAAAPFNQAYAVASVVDADNFTITVANSGATAVAKGSSNLWTARVFEHATITAKTASFDGSYTAPPMFTRLNVSTYVSGSVSLDVIQGT